MASNDSLEQRVAQLEAAVASVRTQLSNVVGSGLPWSTVKGSRLQNATIELHSRQKMPVVGLGTWKSGKGEVQAAVEAAIDAGYRHIDCAAAYGNENEVGAALTNKFAQGLQREEIFIVSKLWNSDHDPEVVRKACEQTLKDLNLQYLDVYLMHWPMALKHDPSGNKFPRDEQGNLLYSDVHFVDTWRAMEALVDAGLVKSLGVSNFNHNQLNDIFAIARHAPTVLQVECHPYLNQQQLFDFCSEHSIAMTAYSPLGSGDRPWAKAEEPILLNDPVVAAIARKHERTPAQVLIRFHIERGWVVIPKSAKPERIQQNADVFSFSLSKDDMRHLLAIHKGIRYCVPCVERDGKHVPRDAHHIHFPFNAAY